MHMPDFDLPSRELAERQADWLAPARGRLLRRERIAGRRRVLDLACGFGAVSGELARRCGGLTVALDRNRAVFSDSRPFGDAACLRADAARLPLADDRFDLVFCQFALMWMDAAGVVKEIHRVLRAGGRLIACEPDYAAMIEHPAEIATRPIWLAALERAGAEPRIGRRLPGLLADAGFAVRVDFLERLEAPSPLRFDLLAELPLTEAERESLCHIRAADAACSDRHRVVHLPMFLVTGSKQ